MSKNFLYICHFGEDVPSCHIISHPPMGGYWWLLVLAWDKWPAQMVHQCTKVYGIWAKMSHHITSCHVSPWGAIGGYWCWPGTNGLLKWSTNVQKYMASGPIYVLSCHVMSHYIPPISATAEGTDLILGSFERSLNPHLKF